MTKQVTLTKGGTRVANQETETLRVIGTSPALMDGAKTNVNNQSGNFADLAAVTTAYNNLLATLRTRGVIGGS
ncbi:hypothetical protein ACFV1U_16985 [Streptomyces microflavus]|uniref:hypothetical protein n=1 Tax=Streptomyces microflavus TaxID=1919 RepID=UPI003689899D